MLNLKIDNKTYEVNNCYENIFWDGVCRKESIAVNVVSLDKKEEIAALIGQTISASILDSDTLVKSIDTNYILKEVFSNLPSTSFTVRFEKTIS